MDRVDNAIADMMRARAVLAPMAGVTDIPFRLMARRFGCAFAFTEMIDVNGIVYGNRRTFELMERVPGDSPLGVQLVGQDADKLLYAAEICEQKGFKVIDVNAGCPARKVVRSGKGAALLKDPLKLAAIVRRLVKALTIPVTVKIRSGWDEENLNCMEVAKAVASEGASAVCIHARTKEQMHKGKVRHDITRAVKKTAGIPVFASGDILTAGDAADVLAKTGCDAVFIARGALGRPWLFREINAGALSTSVPSFRDIKDIIIEHFSLHLRFYDEQQSLKRMYKHLAWYLRRFKNLDAVMKEYRRVGGLESFRGFMERLRLDGRRLVV